jgi:hypothetical protein
MSKTTAKSMWVAKDEKVAEIKRLTAPIHFIARVKERYGVDMTQEEYHELLASGAYRGCFIKSTNATIGTINFKGVEIWCLYSTEHKLFLTALPSDIGTNSDAMVQACFSRALRPMANVIHTLIRKELWKETAVFSTDRDAGIYYFSQTKVPTLLMHRHKHGVIPTYMISKEIKRVLNNAHPFIKIGLERRRDETIDEPSAYNEHEDSSE